MRKSMASPLFSQRCQYPVEEECMVIFEPLALTAPSGSAPARRKECAIVVRSYPSTSAGWQKIHRFEPLGALDSWRAEACALPLPLMGLTDGLWPEATVGRSARKPK